MRWIPTVCCVACALAASLLVAPGPAWAGDEIRVVIPDDPFVPELTELAEIRELRRAMGAKHYRPHARLVTAMNTAITEFNARAQEHRTLALALRKNVDEYLEDRRRYQEEDGRFRAACQPPPSKAEVAGCRTWAAKLDRMLKALKSRKIELAQRATELDRELEEGLMAGLRRLRFESVTPTRDALQEELLALQLQKGTFTTVQGTVTRGHGADSDALKPGDPSVAGEYRTGPHGSCLITLPGGLQLMIGPKSTFELDVDPDDANKGTLGRLLEGVIRFVTKGGGRVGLWGPRAHCGVRGTELIQDAPPVGGVVVIVLDGHVTVTPDGGGPPVDLEAPQRVEIGPDGTARPVTQVDPAAVDRWWRKRVGLAGETGSDGTGSPEGVPLLLVMGAAVVFLLLAVVALRLRGGAR